MKKAYFAALFYTVLGLSAGVFYREMTRDFDGVTQLSVLHTHLLALGMLFWLIVLGLAKLFPELANRKSFRLFYWHYNSGLLLNVITMTVIGVGQTQGHEPSGMLVGISGIGHILIAAGLGMLFYALHKVIAVDTIKN